MQFTIYPFCQFLVRYFILSSLLLVLVMSGCAEFTIPCCTIPLAVVIHDTYGKLQCQDIKP